MREFYIRLNLV